MDLKVERAIQAALENFAGVTKIEINKLQQQLKNVFNADQPFMDKVNAMDAVFDAEPRMEALREVFFDLLLVNFFTEDVKKLEEDYLDSEEWEKIEEDTLDRGTELLNLLLYLKECEDEDIQPELGDYLKEFLLVDEDEFQDEHRIYEEVIANQILVESSYQEIAGVASHVKENSEIKELFYPMMSFFHEPGPSAALMEKFISYSGQPEFDAPVYAILISYYKS